MTTKATLKKEPKSFLARLATCQDDLDQVFSKIYWTQTLVCLTVNNKIDNRAFNFDIFYSNSINIVSCRNFNKYSAINLLRQTAFLARVENPEQTLRSGHFDLRFSQAGHFGSIFPQAGSFWCQIISGRAFLVSDFLRPGRFDLTLNDY